MKNQNFKWGAMIRYIITIILVQFCIFFWGQFILPDKEKNKDYIPNGKEYDIEDLQNAIKLLIINMMMKVS